MLLTLAQQQAIKPISPNWCNTSKFQSGVTNFEQLNTEVEELELKKLLGAAFLQAIQAAPTQTTPVNYNLLLVGGSYVNSYDETVIFKGLRYILAYMNFSKYIGESFIADTFTGLVRKKREETENLSIGEIKMLQADAREIAMQEWELIKDYLTLNDTLYPLWHCARTSKVYRPKFSGIKKTSL
jgi:hypothetical protein